MPQIIICTECNEVLYKGDVLKPPQDIIKKFERKCPSCRKKLSYKINVDAIVFKPK